MRFDNINFLIPRFLKVEFYYIYERILSIRDSLRHVENDSLSLERYLCYQDLEERIKKIDRQGLDGVVHSYRVGVHIHRLLLQD